MAQVQRRIVHKQFNSPIGLYSNQNVKETLDRELKTLNNGAVGIDFDDPATTRSGNLAKSAVMAALEEEERERSGNRPGLKRVAWPPPPETSFAAPVEQQQQQQYQPLQQPISQQQSQPVQNQQVAQAQVYAPAPAPTPAYAPVASSQAPQAASSQQQQRPVSNYSSVANPAQSKPLSPLPLLQTSPQTHSPAYVSPRGWAHVNPSRSPSGGYHQQPFYNAPAAQIAPPFEATNATSSFEQPQYQTSAAPNTFDAKSVYGQQGPQPGYGAHSPYAHPPAQQAPQQSYGAHPTYGAQQTFAGHSAPQPAYAQQPAYAPQPAYAQQPSYAAQQSPHPAYASHAAPTSQQLPFQGNPLRKEAPVTQMQAPVYQAQPGTATLHGGSHRRGDTKWPPNEYKVAAAEENEARRKLAMGPAFRPKRANKDYAPFFAQNALTSTYPGYRIPPGTIFVSQF